MGTLNVDFVNPFIAATLRTLEVMASVRPRRGKPFVKNGKVARGDISGVIGLAGEATGSVAITFPGEMAKRIYAGMVGQEAAELDEAVGDAIGEIANMIAGGAKATLSKDGYHFRIAIPSIVVGADHIIEHKGKGPCLVVPFDLEGETFWLEVSFNAGKF